MEEGETPESRSFLPDPAVTSVPLASYLVFCWAVLVLANYLPAFRFPPGRIISVFTTQGIGVSAGGVLAALSGHAGRILAALLVLFAARGAGMKACAVLGVRESGWLAAVPLGLVLLGSGGLGLGMAGLVKTVPLWAVLLGALACFAGGTRDFHGGMPRRPFGPASAMDRFAVIVTIAVSLAALPLALAPEVTYDALAYHIGAPVEYLKIGRIVRLEHNMYTDLPLVLQMDYLFAVAVGGDGAAKILHFMLGLAGILAAARLGARLVPGTSAAGDGDTRGAVWSASFLAATPFIAFLMMRANVDLGVLYLTTAGAFWMLSPGGRRFVLLAGVLLGGAAAVKLTGGYGVFAGAAVCLLSWRATGAKRVESAIFLLAGAALPLAPWLAKTWLMTGNPVYPFGFGFLGGFGWTGENAAIYNLDMSGPTSFNLQYPDAPAWLAAPWLMVMHDRGSDAALGPFALVFIPVLVLLPVSRVSGAIRRLGLFAGVYWLCWFATARDPRFFLPAWPTVCALAAAAILKLAGPAGALLRAVSIMLIALAPAYDSATAWAKFGPGPVFWGAITRERYAECLIPPSDRYVPLAREAGTFTPPGRRVLVVGEVKNAWITAPALGQSMHDTPHLMAWVRESPSAERLAIRFRQANVGTVFYNAGEVAYFRRQFGQYALTSRQETVLRVFWAARLKPVRWLKTLPATVLYTVVPPGTRVDSPPMPGWPVQPSY